MERTGGRTISYEYGLERLSMYAQEGLAERKTEYVYDGRGSVAQEVSYDNVWYNYLLPFTQDTQVESHRYTPFGEQMTDSAKKWERYDLAFPLLERFLYGWINSVGNDIGTSKFRPVWMRGSLLFGSFRRQ